MKIVSSKTSNNLELLIKQCLNFAFMLTNLVLKDHTLSGLYGN